MAQLDPTKIKVESKAVPIWEQEPESFQDIMAEQLAHAPWLMLSFAIHAVLFFLLYLLLPAEQQKDEKIEVQMQLQEEQQIEEPPPPPPPEPVKEIQEIEPVLQDAEITETEEQPTFDSVSDQPMKESAFNSNQWNAAVGMGGGAGGKYGGRGGRGGGKGGGGKATARAIELGLKWLQDHQDDDGKWDCDGFMKHDESGDPCDGPGNAVHDVGVTGLAMLAFLGDGSTMRAGAYKDNIKDGALWLRKQQQDNGLFGTNASNDFIYGHAIATYAMCEAYGLSKYQTLKRNAQNGINYLEYHRNPYSVWRYQPRDNDNDTSVTGWCIMAYESAKYFKLQVNDQALKLSSVWLDDVTDASGRAGYSKAGEPSSRHRGEHMTRFPPERGEAMTAVSLFCRYFMGQDPKEKSTMKDAANLLAQKPPVWNEKTGDIDHYYWYYATYAMYQVGGRQWTDWEKKLNSAVVKTQRLDGNFTGSWDPIGVWGEDGGRVYSTATLVLTLEAYYRYTKLIR
jgi:hypothetical protein